MTGVNDSVRSSQSKSEVAEQTGTNCTHRTSAKNVACGIYNTYSCRKKFALCFSLGFSYHSRLEFESKVVTINNNIGVWLTNTSLCLGWYCNAYG